MPNGNEAVVRKLIEEVVNRGRTGLLTELVAANHIGHDPFGDRYGPEGARIAVAEVRTAFPDLALAVEDLVAAADKVAWRFSLRGTHAGPFMGIPPTGRVVATSGIVIDRLVDGRIAESWVSIDTLSLLRQIGGRTVMQGHAGPLSPGPPEDRAPGSQAVVQRPGREHP